MKIKSFQFFTSLQWRWERRWVPPSYLKSHRKDPEEEAIKAWWGWTGWRQDQQRRACHVDSLQDGPHGLATARGRHIQATNIVYNHVKEEQERVDGHDNDGNPETQSQQIGLEVVVYFFSSEVPPPLLTLWDVHGNAGSSESHHQQIRLEVVVCYFYSHAPSPWRRWKIGVDIAMQELLRATANRLDWRWLSVISTLRSPPHPVVGRFWWTCQYRISWDPAPAD